MFSTKTRNSIIALVASAGFAGAAIVPAASQAQWHTIVVGGQVITHGNYTEGGVSPCTRINGQLGSAENLVGDDHDWLELKGLGLAGKENATKDLENNEAAVLRSHRKPSNTAATPPPPDRTAATRRRGEPPSPGALLRSGAARALMLRRRGALGGQEAPAEAASWAERGRQPLGRIVCPTSIRCPSGSRM